MTRVSTIAAATLAGFVLLEHTSAHIMVKSPVSRQRSYGPEYKAWDDPLIEYCPHCYNARGPKYVKARAYANVDPATLADYGGGEEFPLYFGEFADNGNYLETDEIAKRHGVCGDPEQNEVEGSNVYSTANINWDPLESFKSGQVLEIDLVMNAYHWGHCEFFVCNTDEMDDPDGVPTQGCFNKYPLSRATDDGDASPIDPAYPGRYYVDPECRAGETEQSTNSVEGYNIKMRYVLPDIQCEHCILQMVYYTGNTCKHVGYEEFNPPSWPGSCASNKGSWIELNRYVCGTMGAYPEEFWACSDFSLTSDGTAPAPSPEPSPEPTAEATPAPVTTAKPVAATTPTEQPSYMYSGYTPVPAATQPVVPLEEDDDEGDMTMYEYVGCFVDKKMDRVLDDKLDSSMMTTEFCYNHCHDLGAGWFATQFAYECFCSSDPELDYERHGVTECTMPCMGDESETCGGRNAFQLFKILSTESPSPSSPCSGEAVEAYEQCGGEMWEGSTCCAEGLECVEMVDGGCYSQCRPSA